MGGDGRVALPSWVVEGGGSWEDFLKEGLGCRGQVGVSQEKGKQGLEVEETRPSENRRFLCALIPHLYPLTPTITMLAKIFQS